MAARSMGSASAPARSQRSRTVPNPSSLPEVSPQRRSGLVVYSVSSPVPHSPSSAANAPPPAARPGHRRRQAGRAARPPRMSSRGSRRRTGSRRTSHARPTRALRARRRRGVPSARDHAAAFAGERETNGESKTTAHASRGAGAGAGQPPRGRQTGTRSPRGRARLPVEITQRRGLALFSCAARAERLEHLFIAERQHAHSGRLDWS